MRYRRNLSTADLRRRIDVLDKRIVRLWQRRARVARTIGGRRMAAGGPRIVPSREREVIARYQDALGPQGRELAMLMLVAGRGPDEA